MRKRLVVLVLLGALVAFVPSSASAQISTTGPAGLAREMPRIYGPHMANRSRILNKRKKHRRSLHNKHRRPRRLPKVK